MAGEALVTHPLVRKVAFTGSTPTGERVGALAAKGSKRVTLELGGSDPMIICADADLKRATSAASMGRFYNCGQACLATKRLFVLEQVADEVIEAIVAKAARLRVGIGSEPGSQIGPLHSERQRQTLERQVSQSVAAGGELLAGGGRPDAPALTNGWFYSPTVVLEPPEDSPMAREEVFGPALPIWRVKDLDEAIELANNSPFGLGSSVWTRDLQTAERAAAELDCGYTWINSPTKVYDELPFGGLKASGYGKEHGSEALDYYTDTKSVVVKHVGLTQSPGLPARGLRSSISAMTTERCNASSIIDRHTDAPDKPAFIAADATLGYGDLRRQVCRAGGLLRELGIGREQRVLLVLDDTTVFPIVFLGAMRIGAVPVPVSPLDKADNFATTSRTPTPSWSSPMRRHWKSCAARSAIVTRGTSSAACRRPT